ncbi:MAG: hypothetical protein MHMPM18_000968 [Marteilia pararefringens]
MCDPSTHHRCNTNSEQCAQHQRQRVSSPPVASTSLISQVVEETSAAVAVAPAVEVLRLGRRRVTFSDDTLQLAAANPGPKRSSKCNSIDRVLWQRFRVENLRNLFSSSRFKEIKYYFIGGLFFIICG